MPAAADRAQPAPARASAPRSQRRRHGVRCAGLTHPLPRPRPRPPPASRRQRRQIQLALKAPLLAVRHFGAEHTAAVGARLEEEAPARVLADREVAVDVEERLAVVAQPDRVDEVRRDVHHRHLVEFEAGVVGVDHADLGRRGLAGRPEPFGQAQAGLADAVQLLAVGRRTAAARDLHVARGGVQAAVAELGHHAQVAVLVHAQAGLEVGLAQPRAERQRGGQRRGVLVHQQGVAAHEALGRLRQAGDDLDRHRGAIGRAQRHDQLHQRVAAGGDRPGAKKSLAQALPLGRAAVVVNLAGQATHGRPGRVSEPGRCGAGQRGVQQQAAARPLGG